MDRTMPEAVDAPAGGALTAVGSAPALPPDGLEPVTLALLGLRPLPAAPRWPGLSPTESRVAARLALGATYREIAVELGSSPKTIETHRRNLLTKLGLRSTVALVRYAIRRGLVEADESAYERGRLIQSEAATRHEEERMNRTNYTATPAAGLDNETGSHQ